MAPPGSSEHPAQFERHPEEEDESSSPAGVAGRAAFSEAAEEAIEDAVFNGGPFFRIATACPGEQFADPFGTAAHSEFSGAEKIAVDQAPFIWIARVQPSNAISDSISGYANRSDNTIDFSVLSKSGG